jgi:hypothetical protein
MMKLMLLRTAKVPTAFDHFEELVIKDFQMEIPPLIGGGLLGRLTEANFDMFKTDPGCFYVLRNLKKVVLMGSRESSSTGPGLVLRRQDHRTLLRHKLEELFVLLKKIDIAFERPIPQTVVMPWRQLDRTVRNETQEAVEARLLAADLHSSDADARASADERLPMVA